MWVPCWMLLGFAAFALVTANLLRAALGKRRGWQLLLFASLTCGALALLCALLEVDAYVREWLPSSLLDVVPALVKLSVWAACLGLVLNLLALYLHLRSETRGNQ
ncbi:MAG: hypothetical protein K2P37_05735 [Oscillospiraceae bacterium]|nr:hypothetical protein [Oscillospiraceae bacterium]